ncbi:hypothetical protein LAZ67_19001157 [Cordylochernes scorpioides]|uniref:Uncharacterized protein n=1 Tax=Cordylochernes scorpioides TaxID=51811 RepID=A0ABY6LHM0_9ARAC|nr:hypothetical protein LAZ67_19001157 [Cordylochernes scorpioides]
MGSRAIGGRGRGPECCQAQDAGQHQVHRGAGEAGTAAGGHPAPVRAAAAGKEATWTIDQGNGSGSRVPLSDHEDRCYLLKGSPESNSVVCCPELCDADKATTPAGEEQALQDDQGGGDLQDEKKKILESLVFHVVIYGCESWVLRKEGK